MITARVSNVAAFARWKADEESDVGWLINQILDRKPTEAMEKGTAFHKFLEHAQAGEVQPQSMDGDSIGCYPSVTVDGYTFAFVGDFELYLPMMREWRKGKDYGGIIVSGQCDAIEGNTIIDHKTTTKPFDAEQYLESYQHRFYLDIFGADRFVWNVWEMNELTNDAPEDSPLAGTKAYGVHHLHKLTAYRYPALEADCTELAQEYLAFAKRYMPQLESVA